VNYIIFSQVFKSVEKLNCKSTNQAKGKTFKFIELQELVKIDGHKFESNAQMLSENNVVFHVDDIHCVFLVVIA